MSPITRLTESGHAREFVYITYPPFPPEQNSGHGPFVAHIPTLWVAFRDAANEFVSDAGSDPVLAARVERNMRDTFVTRTR